MGRDGSWHIRNTYRGELMAMDPSFKIIDYGSPQWEDAVLLREKVLRHSIGSSFSKAELEEESKHIQVASYLEGDLVGTAVLVNEGNAFKVQRVAVDENFRNKNIGSKMMQFCESIVIENNANSIYCHARDKAVDFYLQNGYKKEGEYFQEDGIPHLKMLKSF